MDCSRCGNPVSRNWGLKYCPTCTREQTEANSVDEELDAFRLGDGAPLNEDEIARLSQLFTKQLEEAEIRHLAKRLYVALTEQRVIDCSKYGPGVYAPHTFEDCYIMLTQDTKGGTDEDLLHGV